jgi:hypothetical protein
MLLLVAFASAATVDHAAGITRQASAEQGSSERLSNN